MNGSILVSEIKEWNRTKSIPMAYDIMNKLNRAIDCGRVIVRVGKGKGNIFMNKYDKIANIITGAAAVAYGEYVTADRVKRVSMERSGPLTNEIIIELKDSRIAKASIHKDFVPDDEFKAFVEHLGQVWRENDKKVK